MSILFKNPKYLTLIYIVLEAVKRLDFTDEEYDELVMRLKDIDTAIRAAGEPLIVEPVFEDIKQAVSKIRK